MKKKPLHKIKFEQHVLTRDQTGEKKRKVPQEVSSSYTSKPAGEPAIDTAYFEAFRVPSESSKPFVLTALPLSHHYTKKICLASQLVLTHQSKDLRHGFQGE